MNVKHVIIKSRVNHDLDLGTFILPAEKEVMVPVSMVKLNKRITQFARCKKLEQISIAKYKGKAISLRSAAQLVNKNEIPEVPEDGTSSVPEENTDEVTDTVTTASDQEETVPVTEEVAAPEVTAPEVTAPEVTDPEEKVEAPADDVNDVDTTEKKKMRKPLKK